MPLPGTEKLFPSSAGAGGHSEPQECTAARDPWEGSRKEEDHRLHSHQDLRIMPTERSELEERRQKSCMLLMAQRNAVNDGFARSEVSFIGDLSGLEGSL